MLAVRYYGIHDVRTEEIDRPKYKADEVLVKVAYAGICGSDLHIYNKGMFIQNIPETMGHEFVGTIAEIGDNVKKFSVGDKIVANPMVPCGICASCQKGSYNTCEDLGFIGEVSQGCFAEYIAVNEEKLIKVLETSDLRTLALTEPLAVAVNICRRANLKPCDRLAIVGAGPIGLLTIAVAKSVYRVSDITAVDLSEKRLALAKTVGASSAVQKLGDKDKFNKIIEAAGAPATFSMAMNHIEANGFIFLVSIFEKNFEFDVNALVSSQVTLVGCNVYTTENLKEAVRLIAERKVDVESVISCEYPLKEGRQAFELLCSADKSAAKVLFKIS